MPIYEYECNRCGHRLEAFQKMSEAPLVQCPECQGDSLQKLVSAAGFQLKGTGWYVTDFRNKDKPKSAEPKKEDPSPATATTDQGSAKTTDSKKTDSSGTTGTAS